MNAINALKWVLIVALAYAGVETGVAGTTPAASAPKTTTEGKESVGKGPVGGNPEVRRAKVVEDPPPAPAPEKKPVAPAPAPAPKPKPAESKSVEERLAALEEHAKATDKDISRLNTVTVDFANRLDNTVHRVSTIETTVGGIRNDLNQTVVRVNTIETAVEGIRNDLNQTVVRVKTLETSASGAANANANATATINLNGAVPQASAPRVQSRERRPCNVSRATLVAAKPRVEYRDRIVKVPVVQERVVYVERPVAQPALVRYQPQPPPQQPCYQPEPQRPGILHGLNTFIGGLLCAAVPQQGYCQPRYPQQRYGCPPPMQRQYCPPQQRLRGYSADYPPRVVRPYPQRPMPQQGRVVVNNSNQNNNNNLITLRR